MQRRRAVELLKSGGGRDRGGNLSRPLTYLSWTAHSIDGDPHAVSIAFATGAALAVNDDQESVVWGKTRDGDLEVMHIGTNQQPMLHVPGMLNASLVWSPSAAILIH